MYEREQTYLMGLLGIQALCQGLCLCLQSLFKLPPPFPFLHKRLFTELNNTGQQFSRDGEEEREGSREGGEREGREGGEGVVREEGRGGGGGGGRREE